MLFFYDTNILLRHSKTVLDNHFYISSITINELENIKSSGTKDEETKYLARQALHLLEDHQDLVTIVPYKNIYMDDLIEFDLPNTNDSKIIATVNYLKSFNDDVIFYTNDLACKTIAEMVGINTSYIKSKLENDYTGFKMVELNDNELADFYNLVNNSESNIYGLLDNQYLVIKNNNKIVDRYKWCGGRYENIPYSVFQSRMFGSVKPYKNDTYQLLAMDSLRSNQITAIRGHAGTGKSWLAMSYLFSELEHGGIEKIIIFCNTVAAKGAAKLGFYPGGKDEKLLDSQIGNFLTSKLGDKTQVERMIEDGELLLVPLADIRGFDTTGMKAGIYITEAQNLDIELMKLALQRISEDSIVILDGDDDAQVDLSSYAGENNGLRRVSQVFRGTDIYGEVELQNIYRSRIAAIADQM